MRFYGIRSGRNNMSRMIARSIMYNTPKKSNTPTTNNSNGEIDFGGLIIVAIIICLIIL